jgi:hypothetical protein
MDARTSLFQSTPGRYCLILLDPATVTGEDPTATIHQSPADDRIGELHVDGRDVGRRRRLNRRALIWLSVVKATPDVSGTDPANLLDLLFRER